MNKTTETYLGDGLYASFDGYSIWLRAPHEGGDHVVALEPPVFQALIEYAKVTKTMTQQYRAAKGARG